MKTTELNAFVNKQHMRGMTDQAIAGSLGLTLERLYYLMSRDDESGVDEDDHKNGSSSNGGGNK